MVINYYAAVPLALSLGALFYMLCKNPAGAVTPDANSLSECDVDASPIQLTSTDNSLGTMGLNGGDRMDTFIDMTFESDIDSATYHL